MGSDPSFRLVAVRCEGIRVALCVDGSEVGHAYLYLFKNDVHEDPAGYLEDAFVEERSRGHGLGKELIRCVIREARNRGCYKLVATSRYSRTNVHRLYKRLGLKGHGTAFRLDFREHRLDTPLARREGDAT